MALQVMVALCASMLWMVVGYGGVPVHAATRHVVADHGQRTTASSGAGSGQTHTGGHGHKEGPLAVALSVIGIIVVVVTIVALGSLSVRRRTRDGPPSGPRDPRDRPPGFFG